MIRVRTLFIFALLATPTIQEALSQGNPHSVRQPAALQEEQLMIRGMTQAFLGYHDKAVAYYQKALQLNPASATINSALAEAYEGLEDFTSAITHAGYALDIAPDQIHYYQHLISLYLQQEDHANAEATLARLLERFPENLQALEDLAFLQFSIEQYDKALLSYQKLAERLGPKEHISYRILQIYSHQNDAAGVERTLIQMDELTPQNSSLKRSLAELYLQTDRPAQAEAVLKEAMAIDSLDAENIAALAELYDKTGQPEKAEALWNRDLSTRTPEDAVTRATRLYARSSDNPETVMMVGRLLEQALASDPEMEDALILLGNIRFEEKAYREAGELLYKAVQVNPKSQDIWLQASAAYLRLGDSKRAADIADEALLLFPGQIPLLRVAAHGYLDAYQNAQAIRRFNEFYRLLENEPSQRDEKTEILASLGLLYTRTGDLASSDSVYAMALASHPDHATLLNNFAFSLAARSERLNEALTYAKRAVELEPSNASYLDTLGWVYFKMGDINEAESWIQKSILTGRATAITYEHLGDIQVKQGKQAEATASWHKALEMNPESKHLLEKLNNN